MTTDVSSFIEITQGGVGLDAGKSVKAMPTVKEVAQEAVDKKAAANPTVAAGMLTPTTTATAPSPLPPLQENKGLVVEDGGGRPGGVVPPATMSTTQTAATAAASSESVRRNPIQELWAAANTRPLPTAPPPQNVVNPPAANPPQAPMAGEEEELVDPDLAGELDETEFGDVEMEEPVAMPPASSPAPSGLITQPSPLNAIESVQQAQAAQALAALPQVVEQVASAIKPAMNHKTFADDGELQWTLDLENLIAEETKNLRFVLGLALFDDSNAVDKNSHTHRAMWYCRWAPQKLVELPVQDLCSLEAALSAHQVYVQAQENRWQANYQFLGRELERVLRIKREHYTNGTKQGQEDKCLAAEPRVQELRARFLIAQAMAQSLQGMGERVAQLEDGIKRLISYRIEEARRAQMQRGV